MSAAHIDRISAGYALPFTEQIKYAIRTMTYGELLNLAEDLTNYYKPTEKEHMAKALWSMANAPLKDEKEQTKEERTSVSGGLYAP